MRITSPDVTHVLIAGTTGSGKTALARTLLASLAANNRADDLRLVLIDPKERGFSALTALPNVWGQLASRPDDAQAKLADGHRRDGIDAIDAHISRPILVVAIDELADLIQTGGKAGRAGNHAAVAAGPRVGISTSSPARRSHRPR